MPSLSPARWLLPLLPLGVLCWGLDTAPSPQPGGPGDAKARARVAASVRGREARMRRQAMERFPADPWSQGDDFANAERHLVRQLARREGMRPGAVLDAIDRDVRERPRLPGHSEPTRGRVAPCMPRVFYF